MQDATPRFERVAKNQLRRPQIVMVCSLAISLTLTALLAYTAIEFSQATDRSQNEYSVALDLAAEIQYRDEVLTMSALMAASSGETTWLDRYEANVAVLDDALAQTRDLGSDGLFALDGLEELDAANTELLAIEEQALGLVSNGRSPEAHNILRSERYVAAKTRYSQGISQLTTDMTASIGEAKNSDRRRAVFALSVALTAALATLLLSVLAWHSLAVWRQRRVSAIVESEQTQRKQRSALSELQIQLDSLAANSGIDWFNIDMQGNFLSASGLRKDFVDTFIDPGADAPNVFKMVADHPKVLADIRRALAGEVVNERVIIDEFAKQSVYIPRINNGTIEGVMGISTDITAEWRLQQELQRQAEHDSLTGLLNRSGFEKAVDDSLAQPGRSAAMLLLDVSGLRSINDSRGHEVGDRALTAIGARIANLTKDRGIAARIGGDEFCVLIHDINGEEISTFCKRLLACVTSPIADLSGLIKLQAHVGFDGPKLHSRTFRGELAAVDIALSHARNTGQLAVQFQPEMMHDFAEETARIEELAQAIEQRKLHVAYQPIWDAVSGDLAGAEALARWHHPERGNIPPGEFVPRAEKAGLIRDLDKLIVEQACAQLGRWQRSFETRNLRLSINLSAEDLDDDELAGRIETLCMTNGLEPSALLFELTESTAMKNLNVAQQRLIELRELGCQLALDDFGTGYSSLSQLQNLAVDELKLDRSFVSGDSSHQQELSAMIVGLAKLLDLSVVAEGVETNDQLQSVRRLGCDYVQGFLLAKPLLAPDFEALVISLGDAGHAAWEHRRQPA